MESCWSQVLVYCNSRSCMGHDAVPALFGALQTCKTCEVSLRGAAAGGSCRIPASVTGVLGFRPTTGCWPAADGIVPMSTTRDTVGAPRDPRRMHAHPVMGWACPSLPLMRVGMGACSCWAKLCWPREEGSCAALMQGSSTSWLGLAGCLLVRVSRMNEWGMHGVCMGQACKPQTLKS